ncbi:DUF58 domain-containing protein [Radiobacillus sp. PE A8.2]|uniref:DUF58 domain-containing protein n=1 Tax=Radiobacillus sp. PE A8.2 TaxID=3380349 RepID=UPI003890B5FE
MFQGGFVSWFLFYGFLPILTYMLLLVLYPISNWKISRHLSHHIVTAGDDVVVDLHIERKFAFPIAYCIVEEIVPESLNKRDTKRKKYEHLNQPDLWAERKIIKQLVLPWFKRSLHLKYHLRQVPRGEHYLGDVRIRTGDFLGFIRKEHVYNVSDLILVYPYKREMVMKEKVSSFDEGASLAYNVNMSNTNVVTGVREYMPGDRFSWIDWKTTARKNTVMTKEFEQEKSSSILIVLDATEFTDLNPLAFEAGVELSASLVEALRKKSNQLGFISVANNSIYFPFHHDPNKKERINQFLAAVQPSAGFPFSQLLTAEMKKMPQGLVTIIIVTHLDEQTRYALDKVRQKSRRIIVYLIKPAASFTNEDNLMIKKLSVGEISVHVLTEEQLIQQKFEVSM